MTNKERKENKLIAEFMGAEWHKDFFKDVCIISPSNISYKFHKSWDWLMPVCQKIDQYLEDNIGEVGYFDDCLRSNDIDVRYQAVVDFINQLTIKTDE
jgi:hypothetical protein